MASTKASESPLLIADPLGFWRGALSRLTRSVSPEDYDTWLENTEGIRLEDDTFIIGTRSEFVSEWLKRRLQPQIIETISDLAGRPLSIAFELIGIAEAGSAEIALLEVRASPSEVARPKLHRDHTFDRFVVGPGNDLAYSAAVDCAGRSVKLGKPLFIRGGVGLGKTHLLHAIGHGLQRAGRSLVCISAEQFENDLDAAVRDGTQERLRASYGEASLLVDDFHLMSTRGHVQREFVRLLGACIEAEQQVVIASEKMPGEISGLDGRLVSRVQGGLVVDMSLPDLNTRIAILRKKAREQHMEIPEDVLSAIAERSVDNLRELEGLFNRVAAYARLNRVALTPELVREALVALEPREVLLPPSSDLIIDVVCGYFELEREDFLGKSRKKRVAYPRQLAMYLMRDMAHRSLVEIGAALGNRDHSTAHHGWRQVERALAIDPEVRRDIKNLRELVEAARLSA